MDPFIRRDASASLRGQLLVDVTSTGIDLKPTTDASVPPIDMAALGGCPQCGVLPVAGAHLCEHGVTPAPTLEMSLTTTLAAEQAEEFRRRFDL